MKDFNKVDVNEIKIGMRFSAPVFFDDGESMFLAEEKTVKQYHVIALTRWNVPFLLTYGHVMGDDEPLSDVEEFDDVEEIEELDEIEEAEAV